jgi:hypothetical protein
MEVNTKVSYVSYSDIDPKCLSCVYFMDASGIQIWCDKKKDQTMPNKACKKYKKGVKND